MNLRAVGRFLPSWKNVLLALLAAVLLILAFPPFELWFTAWFALVPLLWAIKREGSASRSFILGWLFGNIFFFGTCWWLTFAPITYAAFPAPLAYLLLFCVTSVAAIFPGVFAAITAFLLKRFGSIAILAVPVVWVFGEFARYWITGNNWNAVGYSQFVNLSTAEYASLGGVLAVSFAVAFYNLAARGLFLIVVATLEWLRAEQPTEKDTDKRGEEQSERQMFALIDDNPDEVRNTLMLAGLFGFYFFLMLTLSYPIPASGEGNRVIAVQPDVPMSGLSIEKWRELRQHHARLAEAALGQVETDNRQPVTVVFPESPMNFMYEDDPETKEFINGFAAKHNVSVLFNSAEPDPSTGKYFNSAVLVGPDGKKVAQYDKIYLLPFGEAVPFPLEAVMPAFVGSFSYGKEYDLLPLGEAKAGVMICFESHFGQLSREYVRNGADTIIEMTNDGYLGPTPVLRQHLANAVFRAVETNRPVMRVTNVGITAYINERGEVLDAAPVYTEDTRVWSVAKSDGSQTFYVKYGDWFAWMCSIVTSGLILFGFARKSEPPVVAGG